MFVVQHWREDKDSVQGTDTAAPETSSWRQKLKRQLIDFIEFVFECIVLSNNQYIISFCKHKHLMICIQDINAVHGIHTPPYSHLLSLVPHNPTESHTVRTP